MLTILCTPSGCGSLLVLFGLNVFASAFNFQFQLMLLPVRRRGERTFGVPLRGWQLWRGYSKYRTRLSRKQPVPGRVKFTKTLVVPS